MYHMWIDVHENTSKFLKTFYIADLSAAEKFTLLILLSTFPIRSLKLIL